MVDHFHQKDKSYTSVIKCYLFTQNVLTECSLIPTTLDVGMCLSVKSPYICNQKVLGMLVSGNKMTKSCKTCTPLMKGHSDSKNLE